MGKIVKFDFTNSLPRKYKSVIVLSMPDNVTEKIVTHYYTGKERDLKFSSSFFDSWDTDINYAVIYFDRKVAKKRCSILKRSIGQERAKVKDFYRLPASEQVKRPETLINNKH